MNVLNQSSAKIWRFFGIPRSGNHAIIEWVIKNIDDPSMVFLNNCNRGQPAENFSYTTFDSGRGTEKHRANIHREKNRHFNRLLDAIGHAKNVAVSYEIFGVDDQVRHELWDESEMTSNDVRDIFIIRSPLNLLASCIKRAANETVHESRIAAKTQDFLDNQFSHYCGYLQRHEADEYSCIVYDRWGSDSNYRAQKLKNLGIKATDLALGGMTTAGGGSSFDRDQDVASISTSKRWILSLKNPYFINAVNDMKSDATLMAAILKVFPDDHAELLRLGGRSNQT